MKKKKLFVGVLLASAAFSLAACGNGDATTTSDTTPTTSVTTPETTPETPPETTTGTTVDENKVSITFNTNGGNSITDVTIDKGSKVTRPDDPTKEDETAIYKFVGWYKDSALKEEFDFSTEIKRATILYAKWDKYNKIGSVEDFNNFRAGLYADGNYILTADIDLEGVELDATAVYLSSVFDGNGHTIKNASYVKNAANKTGILCRELNGGTVQNVNFLNCTAQYNGETIGIISGMCSGTISISKVEFNACTVSANNYMGMISGRISSSGTKLYADQVTTKNGCKASATSYGGFLLGDIAGGAGATEQNIVKFTNMDIAGEIKGGNLNGSFIFGRIRNNTECTLENSVIRDAQLSVSAMGLLAGGGTTNGKNTNVNIKNVAILNTNAGTLQSLGDLMKADSLATGEFLPTYNLENVYTPVGSTVSIGTAAPKVDKNDVKAMEAEATPEWLKTTIGLDFENIWMTEGENNAKYRLVAATTNVKSADATLVSLKATTSNAQTRFTKGSEFNADGLVITATYSDGVQLILPATSYEVDSSAYNKDAAGTYTITVKGVEKNAAGEDVTVSYSVTLAEQTGFKLDTQFTKLVYTKGEALALDNLIVYSIWSDGIETKEAASNYSIDDAAFDATTAGSKDILISMTGFTAETIKVSVIDSKPVAVDGNIYINVDADATLAFEGEKVAGVETFTTITNAVDYLASANLGDVNKVVYIADGTYFEKITIPASLTNLKFIGESRDNTIIDYDAVEGTLNPLNGQVYKMDCATLHVNATGFGLENITVQNSFDYINDASNYGDPQGFALTINADGAVINNVHLYGNQDTLFFKKGRVYIVDSIVEGNVDFIFGENNGLAFFDNCLINAVYRGETSNTGYVTAMKGDTGSTKPAYGYIFNNCAFTADGDYTTATLPTSGPAATLYALTHNFGGTYDVADESMSLGRPWGGGATISMINCSFTAAYSKKAYTTDDKTKSRWFSMSGNSPINADYSEYGSTGEGAITEAVVGGKILTAAEAANYTADNLFAAKNGGIDWGSAFDYAPALTKLKGMATKTAGTSIEVTSETIEVFATGTYDLAPFIKPWNADNKAITAEVADPTVASYNDGIVTGIASGQTTTITLTCGTLTKVINVTVATGTFYTVDFVTDGTAVASQDVLEGEAISSVETTLDGCKFVGWYEDASYTTAFDVTTAITGAKTLYAKFVAVTEFNPANATSAYWTAKNADGTPMADTAKNYYLIQAEGGDNKTTAPTATTPGAVATYKLGYGTQYLEGTVVGYTKTVNLTCNVATTATSNEIPVTITAYDAAGNLLDTKTGTLTANKVTTKIDVTLTSTTANIATVRIESGDSTNSKNIGVVYAEMTYERNYTAEKSYSIQFGADGNYADYVGSDVTVNNHASEPTSEVKGTISLNVKAGGTVVVTGYPGYYEYSLKVGDADAVAATKEYSYVTVTEDTTVQIISSKYLYSIEVIYPIATDASFLYADGTFKTGNGLSFSYVAGKTVNDNGDSYNFKSATYCAPVFSVAKDCTVTVVGHSKGYGLVDIYVNGVLSTVEIDEDGKYTIAAKANDVIEVACSSADRSKSYVKGVIVDYE